MSLASHERGPDSSGDTLGPVYDVNGNGHKPTDADEAQAVYGPPLPDALEQTLPFPGSPTEHSGNGNGNGSHEGQVLRLPHVTEPVDIDRVEPPTGMFGDPVETHPGQQTIFEQPPSVASPSDVFTATAPEQAGFWTRRRRRTAAALSAVVIAGGGLVMTLRGGGEDDGADAQGDPTELAAGGAVALADPGEVLTEDGGPGVASAEVGSEDELFDFSSIDGTRKLTGEEIETIINDYFEGGLPPLMLRRLESMEVFEIEATIENVDYQREVGIIPFIKGPFGYSLHEDGYFFNPTDPGSRVDREGNSYAIPYDEAWEEIYGESDTTSAAGQETDVLGDADTSADNDVVLPPDGPTEAVIDARVEYGITDDMAPEDMIPLPTEVAANELDRAQRADLAITLYEEVTGESRFDIVMADNTNLEFFQLNMSYIIGAAADHQDERFLWAAFRDIGPTNPLYQDIVESLRSGTYSDLMEFSSRVNGAQSFTIGESGVEAEITFSDGSSMDLIWEGSFWQFETAE